MKITMAKKELQKVTILERVKTKMMTVKEAALKMNLSMRQTFRCLRRYCAQGPVGLVHLSRNKQGNRRMCQRVETQILKLLRTKYVDFGPTFASEKLEKLDEIRASREYLRKLMLKNGLWQKHRKRRQGRKWRPRKECFGELVQADGSPHCWLPGTDQKQTLISFVDDATSKILYAALYENESVASVMDATTQCFLAHGKPLALYTDRGSVYKVNLNNLNDDLCTQYERALDMIGVDIIHAYSPQAKGRIERSFRTLQDRLVKELKLENITTVEAANAFIKSVFVPDYNSRFAVCSAQDANLHTPVSRAKLEEAFCILTERTVTNDWTVRYDNRLLQLDNSRPAIVKPKDHVIIHQKLSGELYVSIRKETIGYEDITHKQREKVAIKIISNRKPHRPAKDHPWRRPICIPKNNVHVSQM